MPKTFILGMLLAAASPVFGWQLDRVDKFTLEEDSNQIRKILGQPALVAEFGPGFISWQFQIDSSDHHEFSHILVIRKSDQRLVSVTRNFDEPQNVDDLFPADQSTCEQWPDSKQPKYSVRLRKLSGGRLLLAMGAAKPGDKTTQLMLIHQSALKSFMPWLESRVQHP